ncbi:lysylphosphatidylglycerol synthase domain-containing protein [Hyphomicrobium sp.]|uniref:lysylphosphatidylglycerol synthase domain-containing protein n=1 Tax=Hyphomicrobium sp. TaxID=82 RepID=UPI002D76C6FF|nr:lysylphosphatidylglycerol synthase domain-containing protein [Hyphomicrobium sp.]HET6389533.1 lysylphosphatidylglycerol synthase domain-containing protein [Hyphomicrobium sp.]
MSAEPAASSSNSRAAFFLAAMAGITFAIGLLFYFGIAGVWDAIATAGWQGMAAIIGAYLASLFFCAWGWRVLVVEKDSLPPGVSFLWARWMRDSIGNLLAIIPGAGEAAGARELSKGGMKVSMAAATTITDMTTEMMSQLIYTFMGLAILFVYHPDEAAAWWAAGGLAIATIAVVGFLIAQNKGLILFLETLPAKLGFTRAWEGLSDADSIHEAIRSIYRDKRAVFNSTVLHVFGWLAGAAETWIALWFMNQALSAGDVLSLESLVFALRTAAFIVPWAAGVQEGGYVVVGGLFGLGPDVALALSLLKRARELITGLPGLLAWHFSEGRRFWQSRLAASRK